MAGGQRLQTVETRAAEEPGNVDQGLQHPAALDVYRHRDRLQNSLPHHPRTLLYMHEFPPPETALEKVAQFPPLETPGLHSFQREIAGNRVGRDMGQEKVAKQVLTAWGCN